MKKLLSLFLAFLFVVGGVSMAYAENSDAKLYSTYGNDMLFQQKKDAVFAGTAAAGAQITAELYNAAGELTASGSSTALSDGTFTVSFLAPAGGYEEYKVILKENSVRFAQLDNVVFGELWLASGQSNMQYPLAQAKGGADMFKNSQKLSKWLRVLHMPVYCNNNENDTFVDPQQDAVGAVWTTGENGHVYNMSAVAYYFAAQMMEELDMPVGVLNASLGGSAIASWLSRDAIDGDSKVKNYLVSTEKYIEKSDWEKVKPSIYHDMTSNYNHKIHPIRHFRPSGMIWYQGETDLMFECTLEGYADFYDLMQRSYSELFGYENERMPFICTQIASYLYSDDGLNMLDWNINYCNIQAAQPQSRATVTIYDVPLTFIPEAGSIHPECKQEIGERMAFAAKGLVYGGDDDYTAATVEKAEIRDGSVYVTFRNTGDGIVCGGEELYGFAVCGAGGVYVQANAEIVSADTVKVWSDEVASPVSASYAYCVSNMRSNLYATADGKLALPVSQFVTDKSVGTHYWFDRPWTDCNDELTWHVMSEIEANKNYSSWLAEDAQITFANGVMNVKGGKEFTLSPALNYKSGKKFEDTDNDYSDYGNMSFWVRNNGGADVELSEIRIYKNSLMWYSPAVNGTKGVEASIPADGQWHLVTVDLNRLYLFGNEGGAGRPCGRLNEVEEIRFAFASENDADISIDNIRFAPDTSDGKTQFDPDINTADTIIEKISAVFIKAIGAIVSIFR